MKDTYFFSHDYNTRTDAKIKKLLAKHGMLGYGVFWSIVEDLYNNANALRLDCDSIAYDLRVDSELILSVLKDFDLFQIQGDFVSSNSIEYRLNRRNEKSKKAAESAKIKWDKEREKANALRTHSDGNAIKDNKGKESIGNETKEENTKEGRIKFDIFWDLYGKKNEREASEKKWNSMSISDQKLALDDIPKYKLAFPDAQFRKNPASYLRNKLWQDRQDDVKVEKEKNDLSPEILVERKLRESKYSNEIFAFEYLRGKPIEFPDRMSVYHVKTGFAHELRK